MNSDANRGFFIPDEADNYGRFSKTTHGRKPLVGIVYSDNDDEEEEIKYCPNCEKYNGKNRLGHRIVKEGDPALPENDMENFLQCYVCGKVFAVHEIEKQKNLQSDLKSFKMDNPFEAGKTIIESIPKRNTPAGRKAADKRRREKNRKHHKDPEIDREIQQHGSENVHILEDTDP